MNFICHSPSTPTNYSNSGPKVQSNRKKTTEDLGEEDGVIGAVDDAEEDHQAVSYSLTSYKIYEFMHCMKAFII
jgi:hypothetical protein